MSRVVVGRRGVFSARGRARPLGEQPELAEVALQRRARRGPHADRQQRAAVGRVGLADGGVRNAGRAKLSFQRQQLRARRGEHHRVRAGRQALREARALTGGVDHLSGEGAARQVVPDDDVMMKKRLLDRAATNGDGRGNNLRGTGAGVNAS
jgi:hypothetical protein